MLQRKTPSKFRGKNNSLRLGSLFMDRYYDIQEESRVHDPLFSLNGDYTVSPGGNALINCRETFIACDDVSGYKWAMKYLESFEHLRRLLDSEWFRFAYDKWVDELKAKQTSDALTKIKLIATGGSPAAFQAAKYIASKEYEKGSKTRGRPSTEEIKGELANAIRNVNAEEADFNRVQHLRIVK